MRWGRRLKSGEYAFAVAPHLKNRMSDKLRYEAELPQRAEHRIEKERHVVVDDVDREQFGLAGEALPKDNLWPSRLTLTEAFESAGGESDEIARAVGFESAVSTSLKRCLAKRAASPSPVCRESDWMIDDSLLTLEVSAERPCCCSIPVVISQSELRSVTKLLYDIKSSGALIMQL